MAGDGSQELPYRLRTRGAMPVDELVVDAGKPRRADTTAEPERQMALFTSDPDMPPSLFPPRFLSTTLRSVAMGLYKDAASQHYLAMGPRSIRSYPENRSLNA